MSKYRSVRTEVDGISFASKREAKRYSELKLLQRAGKIHGLKLQQRYKLTVNNALVTTYVADFDYTDEDGSSVTEDAKGYQTEAFKLKRKLFCAIHGRDVVLV